MTDTNNGRLMITTYACLILQTLLENLRKLLTAFKWTTDDTGGLDNTGPNASVFTPSKLLHEQAVSVHQVKGSTAQI